MTQEFLPVHEEGNTTSSLSVKLAEPKTYSDEEIKDALEFVETVIADMTLAVIMGADEAQQRVYKRFEVIRAQLTKQVS